MGQFLIYGANGYTGALIAQEAAARGHQPVLAGRNAVALAALASTLGLEHRSFALDNLGVIVEGIQGAAVVLHCAGPFAQTFRAMTDACLRTGTHYLDITGEVAVFEALAARDAEAKAKGVMLLPGAGFDVVASDCLAAHLKRRLPTATQLALGFSSLGRMSRGTATTIVENIGGGGLVRQAGILRSVPAAWKTRVIDFGNGPIKVMSIPWGDVSTAYYSTGIPNIEVYTAAPFGQRLAVRASRYLRWLLGSSLMQKFLKRRIRARPPGPTAAERSTGRSFLWGEAVDAAGHKAVSRLRGPEAYTLTVHAALAVVERVLAGEVLPGFQTPSRVYGPDFVLELQSVVREDE
jgi:short subunit dehydrogenase-like uncharacterized protein